MREIVGRMQGQKEEVIIGQAIQHSEIPEITTETVVDTHTHTHTHTHYTHVLYTCSINQKYFLIIDQNKQ